MKIQGLSENGIDYVNDTEETKPQKMSDSLEVALQDALNSVTLDEIIRYGKIKAETHLYEYKGVRYIISYKVDADGFLRCVSFKETD